MRNIKHRTYKKYYNFFSCSLNNISMLLLTYIFILQFYHHYNLLLPSKSGDTNEAMKPLVKG